MDDVDPSLLVEGMWEDHPIHVVETLPLTYDNRLNKIQWKVYTVIGIVCRADRVDLVERLLNGGYIGINEAIWVGGTWISRWGYYTSRVSQ